VNAKGTLGGAGTIYANDTFGDPFNSISVQRGTIRGGVSDGTNNLGTLRIQANVLVTTAPTSMATIQTDVSRTSANHANASLIYMDSGGNSGPPGFGTFTLTSTGTNKFNINVINNGANDVALVGGETYTIVLAQVDTSGNFILNGSARGAYTFPTANYTVTPSGFTTSGATSLVVDSSGTLLELTFTVSGAATPEPEDIMLLSMGALLAGWALRRRWQKASAAEAASTA